MLVPIEFLLYACVVALFYGIFIGFWVTTNAKKSGFSDNRGINIVFRDYPDKPDLVFVEVEDDYGNGVPVGEWQDHCIEPEFCSLRISVDSIKRWAENHEKNVLEDSRLRVKGEGQEGLSKP